MWEYGNEYTSSQVLMHHGILGQKWGVRRFQNPDGTRTAEGKKRERANGAEERKPMSSSTKKKVALGALAGVTIATAAVVYAKNPAVQNAVNGAIGKMANKTVEGLKAAPGKTVKLGKAYVKSTVNGVKEGIKEGVKEAPKTAAKTVVTGITLNATKRILDNAVGKEESARIFKANNKKKIDSFWKITDPEDKDD